MLKHLYKTFLIAILSGSLLMLQTNVAFADVKISGGTNTTDSNGKITNQKAYHFDGVKDFDMVASLGMLGGGFVAARMLATYSPITTDVMIAGAAGAAFIAGEVMTNLKFRGEIAAATIEIEKRTGEKVNEEQIQRLEDLKKSYEEAKETTGTKKTLQLGAAVAFAAAAAMAGYINYQESVAMGKCLQTISTESAKCTPASTTPYATEIKALEAVRKSPGESGVKQSQISLKEGLLSKGATCLPLAVGEPATASANALAAKTAIDLTCNAALLKLKANQVFSYNFKKQSFENKFLKMFLKQRVVSQEMPIPKSQNSFTDFLLNLVINKSEASWVGLLGLPVGAAIAFGLITAATAISVDLFMYSPFNRMLIFGSLGGISLLASKSSENVIEKLEKNIAAIDKILLDLNKNAKGVKAQNIAQEAYEIRTVDPTVRRDIPITANSTVKTPCMSGNNTTNCPPISNELKNMPGFANLPDSFKDIASLATKMGDGVSGKSGISQATLSTAQTLGGKQAAVAKVLKARQDAIEKLTNSPGSIKKGEAKFLDGLSKGVQKALRSQGMTATGMMASIGATPISNAGAGPEKIPELKKSEAPTAAVVDISAKDEKDKSLDLDFKDAPAENFAAIGAGSSSGKEFEIPTNEIGDDNGPSIFEVISSRYIKSGYPKLLEEEPAKK